VSSPFRSTGEAFAQRGRGPQFPGRRALKIKGSPFARGGRVPGYFLGGLFNSTPGTSSTSQSSTTNSQVNNPNYDALMNDTLGYADSALKNSKFTPYVGPNGETNPIVGLTPEQQRGITMAGNNVGNYQPFFNKAGTALDSAQASYDSNAGKDYVGQAANMTTGTQAASPFLAQASHTFPQAFQQYMSPYTQNVVQGIQDASNRNFEQNTMRTINDTFSGGNAAQFGREQHGNAVGNAVFAKTQADDAAIANAEQAGYTTAGNLFNSDANRALQTGQTAGTLAQGDIGQRAGLGTTAAGVQSTNTNAGTAIGQAQTGLGAATQQGGINDVNALEQTGAIAQNTAQNQSNFNYNQFQQQLQYPWQVAQAAQGLGQGWQLPTTSNTQSTGTSTVQQPQGSPFGQILGGALGAASLAIPGAGGVSALGNIFGGIKGWFGGAAEGGYLEPHYATGGMIPTIGAMRKHSARTNMRGMQPTGMPGMPPMAPMPQPGAAPSPMGQMPMRGQRIPYRNGGAVYSPDCFADGGMFLDASEGLDDRMFDQRPRPTGGPYSNIDEPTGRDKMLREDPLQYLWMHVPPHIRDALKFGREFMPDRALEGYVDSSRDLGRALREGHPMDAIGSGSEAALNMMGMALPGAGRAAEQAFSPFVRRMLAGAR